MGRGVGFLMDIMLEGLAKDMETIVRLRPWMESKIREDYGDLGKSKLITDYDQNENIFKFKIIFTNES
jgi:hypothetical protein